MENQLPTPFLSLSCQRQKSSDPLDIDMSRYIVYKVTSPRAIPERFLKAMERTKRQICKKWLNHSFAWIVFFAALPALGSTCPEVLTSRNNSNSLIPPVGVNLVAKSLGGRSVTVLDPGVPVPQKFLNQTLELRTLNKNQTKMILVREFQWTGKWRYRWGGFTQGAWWEKITIDKGGRWFTWKNFPTSNDWVKYRTGEEKLVGERVLFEDPTSKVIYTAFTDDDKSTAVKTDFRSVRILSQSNGKLLIQDAEGKVEELKPDSERILVFSSPIQG